MGDEEIGRLLDEIEEKIPHVIRDGEGYSDLVLLLQDLVKRLTDSKLAGKPEVHRHEVRLHLSVPPFLSVPSVLINRIKGKVALDSDHSTKRQLAHLLLDCYLEKCERGRCPSFSHGEELLHVLASISLEGHTLRLAKEYFKVGCGQDADGNYSKAKEAITNSVLTCTHSLPPKSPLFTLLDCDSKHVMGESSMNWIHDAARRRKAFWAFLHEGCRHGRHKEHYDAAEKFIDGLVPLTRRDQDACTADECNRAKGLLMSGFHLSNVLDLYRFCVIRHKYLSESLESDDPFDRTVVANPNRYNASLSSSPRKPGSDFSN